MNVTAHQEKKKNKETKTGKRRENRRPILRKLCAALLRLFRRHHSEKIKGSARGNWDPREVQQPSRPNPNGVRDRTTILRRLLIGAVIFTLPIFTNIFLPTAVKFHFLCMMIWAKIKRMID